MKNAITPLGCLFLFALQSGLAATFTVINTDDSGPGSLRQAILNANATPDPDTIEFKVPGPGPYIIRPVSALPKITAPVIIDGTTQKGFAGKPIIELDGSGAGKTQGLHVTAGNSTVRGLVIHAFGPPNGSIGDLYGQIFLQSGGTNRVEGNFIGTDVTGGIDSGGCPYGIYISSSSGNVIGGTNAASRNLISGNNIAGIYMTGNTSQNQIQGNLIGVDLAGTSAVGNRFGIWGVAASNNLIGGTSPAERNVISGNSLYAVYLDSSPGNVVQGNFLGTDITGTIELTNDRGVFLVNSASNIIGGVTSGAGNVISGNASMGIGLLGSRTTGTIIQGNLIGTDVSGRLPLGNHRYGIAIGPNASSNTIGGVTPGAGNIIAFNFSDGILLEAIPGNNAIRGNSIFSNDGLGIDLEPADVTENDPGDRDSGVNGLQNFPVLASGVSDGNAIHIQGTLNSKTNGTFTLDFFSTKSPHSSGYGQGENYLGSTAIATDANGDARFNVTLSASVPVGQFVTATATDASNNTSEFSKCLAVTKGAAPPKISIAVSASNKAVTISWPGSADGFVLEETESLVPPVVWSRVQASPGTGSDRKSVEINPATGIKFYRVRMP